MLSGVGSPVAGLVKAWMSWAPVTGLTSADPTRIMVVASVILLQVATATAVVAAKSTIRFPEINAQKAWENGGIGIDDVTEYFLVGSFASWIVALGGLALTMAG
nr:hypothetical protein [Mycolicibacterium sarraceniae]